MYKKSKEIFAELDAVSEGNIKRSYVKGSIPFTKDNKVQQFKGVVTLVDIYNKVGFLKCDSLPNFTDELKFFPKYQAQKNDHVLFNIGFNMRGPLAENVAPI